MLSIGILCTGWHKIVQMHYKLQKKKKKLENAFWVVLYDDFLMYNTLMHFMMHMQIQGHNVQSTKLKREHPHVFYHLFIGVRRDCYRWFMSVLIIYEKAEA